MYISIKLINKLFNCNIIHMLQGHACNVNKQVLDEIDELRIKFALYVKKISNKESLIYLKNNSLIPQNIKTKLNSISNDNEINSKDEKKLKNIVSVLKKSFSANESEINKINYIYEIFQNAIQSVNICKKEFDKDIHTYNYKKINDKINAIKTNYRNKDFSIFKKAYYNYKIGNLEFAYNELKKISYETYKNKNYLIYVISCLYQYRLGLLIENYYMYDKNLSENLKNIIDNYKDIEVYKLIDRYINDDLKDILKSIVDLSFFKDLSLDIKKIDDDIEKMYANAKKGSIGFSNSLSQLYQHIYDAYCFISNNYMMPTEVYEISELFKRFIHAMLQAYAVNEIAKNKEKGEPIYSGGMTCFDLFDIYVMIEFGKYEDIKSNCEELKINTFKLELDSVKFDIINTLENFYKNQISNYSIYNFSEKFKILLFIISKLELKNSDIEKIINILSNILNVEINNNQIENYNFMMSKMKIIGEFIFDIYNKYPNIKFLKTELIEKIFIYILTQVQYMDYFHAKATGILQLLYAIYYILNEDYKKYKFKQTEDIIRHFSNIQDNKMKILVGSKIYKFIINNKKIKDEIISLYKIINDEDLIDILNDLIESKIIIPNNNIQNKIILLAKKSISSQILNIKSYHFSDRLFSVLSIILFLLKRNKWILTNELISLVNDMQECLNNEFVGREVWWKKTYKDFIDIINLYINIEKTNFDSININLLANINDSLLAKIKNYIKDNPYVKNCIIKNILENKINDDFLRESMTKLLDE